MRKTTLGEYVDVVSGVSYNPADITEQGVRILRGGNIQNGEILLKQDDVFLDRKYMSSVNQVQCGDTIVVASTGSTDALGKAATSWSDIAETQIGAFLRIVRPKERKYAALVSAWLTQPIFSSYIVNKAKGTGINNIRREHLLDYKIDVPDDDGLAEFSALYEAIESKIALNRKKIEKLEALAKTIYDYWFVQFDFPDANGRPYKSSGGKMAYNPILKREIPDGWEVEALGKRLCNFSNGINYSQAIEGDKEYRIVNVRDISASSLFIMPNQLNRIILPSSLADRYLIPQDSILIARSGIPGAIRRLGTSGDIIYCGFIICCCTTEKNYLAFLTYFLKALEGSGATRKDSSILDNVSQDMLKRISVFRPPKTLLESFEKTISKIFDDVVKIQEYTVKLTSLRDFLLPLLMNGQVEVGE